MLRPCAKTGKGVQGQGGAHARRPTCSVLMTYQQLHDCWHVQTVPVTGHARTPRMHSLRVCLLHSGTC